jgi:hypothetical protein
MERLFSSVPSNDIKRRDRDINHCRWIIESEREKSEEKEE